MVREVWKGTRDRETEYLFNTSCMTLSSIFSDSSLSRPMSSTIHRSTSCVTLRSYFHGSINGENVHYGTPRNPCAADRVPGGSSSGSAVAVGATLADFSLGKFLLSFFSSSPKFDGFRNPVLSACLDHR